MNRAMELIKNSGILWEKKKRDLILPYSENENYVSPDNKHKILNELKEDTNKYMSSASRYHANIKSFDESQGIQDAIEKHKPANFNPKFRPYRDIENSSSAESSYRDRALGRLTKNKEYENKYGTAYGYGYELNDAAKVRAEKEIDNLKSGRQAEFDTHHYDDSKLRGEIDIDHKEGLKKDFNVKKKEFFRKARNVGRVGLAGGALYGASKLFGTNGSETKQAAD